jgi:hypothetical protein
MFEVADPPGREHLLAIMTDVPLQLDWLPSDPDVPERQLFQEDIDALVAQLGASTQRGLALKKTYLIVEPASTSP